MATVTRTIGPADHGRAMTLGEFIDADFEEAWLYELGRGVLLCPEMPEINHGRIIGRLVEMFFTYKVDHPRVIHYRAGSSECRVRLPGMGSDRGPDQAIYLTPPPPGPKPWTRWTPALLVEVVSKGSEDRDFVEKREEYLRAGVTEYWILDPTARQLKLHLRAGDTWEESVLDEHATHRPHFLPGLQVRPADLFGPQRSWTKIHPFA